MVPMVLGLMSGSIISGQITSKTGKYKIFMVSGTAMMTVAYAYLATIKFDWQIWQVSVGMVVLGLGLGQLMQTLTIAAQNAVSGQDVGVATSSATFFRQMGGTLGVAVFLSILFNEVGNKAGQIQEGIKAAIQANPALIKDLDKLGGGQALGDLISSDSSFLKTLNPALAAPIKQAFAESASLVFLSAGLVVVVAFVVSLFVKEIALRSKSSMQEKAEAAAAAIG
jgi:hypothetical protein